MADIVRMTSQPWNPPSPDQPAARAVYFGFVSDQIAQATGEPCSLQWLLAGGIPDPLDDLQRETYDLRMKRTAAELREMAKQELSTQALGL